MNSWNIAALGAVAGFTIFLGLPVARLRTPATRTRVMTNALAAGVLLFLMWDVLVHATEPLETALTAAEIDHSGSWTEFTTLTVVAVCGLLVGLMSLVYYERWMTTRPATSAPHGPGAANIDELPATTSRTAFLHGTSSRARLALLIAVGIGLHNFSEGLAIGQSAATGAVNVAAVLIIGFGLHNATEGFGIVAPLAGATTRPRWRFLALSA